MSQIMKPNFSGILSLLQQLSSLARYILKGPFKLQNAHARLMEDLKDDKSQSSNLSKGL